MSSVADSAAVATGRAAVIEELRAPRKTVVVSHENPDGDALGSLIAMRALLEELGHDSLMFISTGDLPLPYEYGFLPLERLVSEAPEDLEERTVIFLDCGNIERNRSAEILRPQDGWGRILNIDHHHDNTRFGSVNYVDPDASCTAEMVWDLAAAFGATLSVSMAVALYVGLITDTGCFMYSNTGPRAHRMAAELIEGGVDVHGIYKQVYEGVPFGKLELLARGLANAERYDDGRLTASQLSAEDFAASDAQESYSEGVIDHLRAVRGTKVAALARDRLAEADAAPADGQRLRKVSLRASDQRIDVSAIARALGGGGHRAAAGFSTSMTWDELIGFLREQLAEQLTGLPDE